MLLFPKDESKNEDEDEDEDEGFEGVPKPMLPYSSMFIFGPTNPYVPQSVAVQLSQLMIHL